MRSPQTNPPPPSNLSSSRRPRLAGFVRSLPAESPGQTAAKPSPSRPLASLAGRSDAEVDREAETRMEDEGGPPPRSSSDDATGRKPSQRARGHNPGGQAVTRKIAPNETIRALNDLLQGELAAVETYNEALPVLRTSSAVADNKLDECQASHQRRVLGLRAEILERGGEPATKPGAWGMFARLFEKGARILGPKMALNALEAGEDHGLKEYAEFCRRWTCRHEARWRRISTPSRFARTGSFRI